MLCPMSAFRLAPATEADVALLLQLITELAEYEKLTREVVATEDGLRAALFGAERGAEAVIAFAEASAAAPGSPRSEAAGFALYFHNFSTFQGRRGLYLEDLYVRPQWRGQGLGRELLRYVARVAVARGCGRMEWSVLDWNEPAIGFYRKLDALSLTDWTVFRLAGEALARLAAESEP